MILISEKQEGEYRMQWIKDRLVERTTYDGAVLIAVALVVLLLGPLASWAAYAALIYGAWTVWAKD